VVSGFPRLFGPPSELAAQMRRASSGPVRIGIAHTQSAAALVALGRPGVVVIAPDEQRQALAKLSVRVVAEFERIRLGSHVAPAPARAANEAAPSNAPMPATTPGEVVPARNDRASTGRTLPPHVAEMEDVLPYFQHSLRRTTDAAAAPHLAAAPAASSASPVANGSAVTTSTMPAPSGGGWTHPRDAHVARNTRRPRRAVTAPREVEHAHAAVASTRTIAREQRRNRTQEAAIDALLETLRRWGVTTFGALAALPPGEVYERLGARGVMWQRLARGEDATPLVPWVPEDPFESSLDLEWPIEGLEPLSFVLGRLFEPLAERLERADRGAAILHTHLRLVDKSVHARTVQLPSPMRDPKTLRTLVLLDLESNPPTAAIDRVRVLIEPTPARVTQWALFERAQASPEQVSTLVARLTALMGDSHVGSPRLVDSWRAAAFEMMPFDPDTPGGSSTVAPAVTPSSLANTSGIHAPAMPYTTAETTARSSSPHAALRRFRLPVPARVQMQEGRPVRITTDRRGVVGGVVVDAAGPWRTSGEWWNDGAAGRSWDRDEWDVALNDGTVYRLFVERDVGQWFLDGIVD
jgi:protein ImuB